MHAFHFIQLHDLITEFLNSALIFIKPLNTVQQNNNKKRFASNIFLATKIEEKFQPLWVKDDFMSSETPLIFCQFLLH